MKRYSDSTLKSLTKTQLIEIIRCLEHNVSVLEEMNDNQFRLLCEYDKQNVVIADLGVVEDEIINGNG